MLDADASVCVGIGVCGFVRVEAVAALFVKLSTKLEGLDLGDSLSPGRRLSVACLSTEVSSCRFPSVPVTLSAAGCS